MTAMEGTWTILELAERAAETLAALTAVAAQADEHPPAGSDGSAARANGRVRDVPNERLIRWYATVGLIDPPLSRRGRVAQYGQRHLLQLVAVKRRQAEGRSLAEIQAELAGATDAILADIACLPDNRAPDDRGPDDRAPDDRAPDPGDRFWMRRPRQQLAATAGHDDHSPGLVHGVSLAPGVVLLLDGTDRAPSPDDITAIANAARPLLEELADRGLSASGPDIPPGPDNPPGIEGAGHDR
jgi:DNA-binding transcriptional MerR regulator